MLILWERNNNINKLLVKLSKKKKWYKLMKLEEKGEKTDMKRNQRIISTYFKNPYFSKLENLKEINEILDMYDLPKLNQE